MASVSEEPESSAEVAFRKISYHFCNATVVAGGIQEVLQSGVQGLCIAQSQVEDPVFKLETPIGLFVDVQEIYLSATIISEFGLYSLIRSCPDIKILSLGVNTLITDQICRAIGMCKELLLFELKGEQGLTARGIKAILQGSEKLHTLNLSFTRLSDNGFTALAQYAPPSLKILDIYAGDVLEEKHVAMLKDNCPHIQTMTVNLVDRDAVLLPQLLVGNTS